MNNRRTFLSTGAAALTGSALVTFETNADARENGSAGLNPDILKAIGDDARNVATKTENKTVRASDVYKLSRSWQTFAEN